MPKIECKDLKFSYYNKKGTETQRVFESFNATFLDNKITVLLGESGCGKSTLLHLISGLNENFEGEILINEKNSKELTIRDRRVAYVTQNIVLYPHMTIFENIAFPLKHDDDIETEEIYVRVRNIAKVLKIDHCLSRKPKHLSIGQQQRVLIARALVKDPEIILIDEAFSNIDKQTKDDLIAFLKQSKEELNATVIVVTHDYNEVLSLADEVQILEEGKIKSVIKKEDISKSFDDYLMALRNNSTI